MSTTKNIHHQISELFLFLIDQFPATVGNMDLMRKVSEINDSALEIMRSRRELERQLSQARDLVFKCLCTCNHSDAPVSRLCPRCEALDALNRVDGWKEGGE